MCYHSFSFIWYNNLGTTDCHNLLFGGWVLFFGIWASEVCFESQFCEPLERSKSACITSNVTPDSTRLVDRHWNYWIVHYHFIQRPTVQRWQYSTLVNAWFQRWVNRWQRLIHYRCEHYRDCVSLCEVYPIAHHVSTLSPFGIFKSSAQISNLLYLCAVLRYLSHLTSAQFEISKFLLCSSQISTILQFSSFK